MGMGRTMGKESVCKEPTLEVRMCVVYPKEEKRSQASASSALKQTFYSVSMDAHRSRTWHPMDEDAHAASLSGRWTTGEFPSH